MLVNVDFVEVGEEVGLLLWLGCLGLAAEVALGVGGVEVLGLVFALAHDLVHPGHVTVVE